MDAIAQARRVPLRLHSRQPLNMWVKPDVDRFLSAVVAERGIWEPYNTALLQTLLRPGDHVMDLGANLGYFTLLAADLVGSDGKVWAFEPDPENYDFCHRNVAENGFEERVGLSPYAVAERAGRQILYRASNNHGAHQLGVPRWHTAPDAAFEVETLSLDQWASADPGRQHLDFLKIDVQGFEPRVFRGMTETLQRNRAHLMMLTEISPGLLEPHDAVQAGIENLFDFLHQQATHCFVVSRQPAAALDVRLVPVTLQDLRQEVERLLEQEKQSATAYEQLLDVLLLFSDEARHRLDRRAEGPGDLPFQEHRS